MRGVAFSEDIDTSGLGQTRNKKFFGLFWNFLLTSIAPRPSHKPRPGVRRQIGTSSSLSEFPTHAPDGEEDRYFTCRCQTTPGRRASTGAFTTTSKGARSIQINIVYRQTRTKEHFAKCHPEQSHRGVCVRRLFLGARYTSRHQQLLLHPRTTKYPVAHRTEPRQATLPK